jgi:hypothetical protein
MSNYILKYDDVIKNKNIKNCMSADMKYRHVMPVIVCDREGWKAFNTDEYYLKIHKPVELMNIEELEQEIRACYLVSLEHNSDFKKNYGDLSVGWCDLFAMFHLRRSKCQQELLARKNYYRNLEDIEFVLEDNGFKMGISKVFEDGRVFGRKLIDDSHVAMFWPGYRKLLIHEFDWLSYNKALENHKKLNISPEEFKNNYEDLYFLDHTLVGNSDNPNGSLIIFEKLSGEWHRCGQEYSFEYKDGWENELPSFLEDSIKNFHYPNCQKCGDPMYTETVHITKINANVTYWKCCSSKKKNCRKKYECGKENLAMTYPFFNKSFTLA